MASRSDKGFHLTVTAFAVVLTMVSAGTIIYEHDPAKVRGWINALSHTQSTTPTHRAGWQNDTATGKSNPPGAPGANSNTSPSQTSALSLPVNVKAFGNDVPSAKVAEVKSLLTDYHVIDTVTQTLQMTTSGTVQIYLAQNASDYKSALNTLGVSTEDAQRYSRDTGGFTMGDDIVVPLYQNQSKGDLANTLAHELTHTVLNANTENLASWVNEGLAVYNGMKVQEQVENPVSYEGYAKQMAESVIQAAVTGHLVPLAEDESQVLSGNAPYDLELQDWLAISDIMHTHGAKSVNDYLDKLRHGKSADDAFQSTFGESFAAFNSDLASLFKQAAHTEDQGVVMNISVTGAFHGMLRTLQHGSSIWHGMSATQGTTSVTVLPDGTLQGSVGEDVTTHDKNSPDNVTMYIDLDPDSTLTKNGKTVSYCGFALDYHYGMYGFVNGWITYKDGKTDYVDDPQLFGVTLTSIHEVSKENPILPLLHAAT